METENNSIQNTFQEEESSDIKSSIEKYLHYWKFFVISIAICLIAAFIYNRYAGKVYVAKTRILLKDDRKGKSSGADFMDWASFFNTKVNVANEIEIIQSFNFIKQVVQNLDYKVSYFVHTQKTGRRVELYKNSPFRVILDTNRMQVVNLSFYVNVLSADKFELQIKDDAMGSLYNYAKDSVSEQNSWISEFKKIYYFGEPITTKHYAFKILLNDKYNAESHFERDYFFKINNPNIETENFISNLSVNNPSKEITSLDVELKSNLDSKAVDFINALTEEYIGYSLKEKNIIAQKTIAFIDTQLSGINDSLQRAEDNLQKFKQSKNLMDIESQATSITTKATAVDESKFLSKLKTKYYEYLYEHLLKNKDIKEIIYPSSLGIEDATITAQIDEISRLISEKNVMALSSTEKNPYFMKIEAQIETAKKALIETVKNSINVSKISLTEYSKKEKELQALISTLPETDRQFVGIQRKYTINNEIYTYLLKKRAEAEIARVSNIADKQILSLARSADMILPKKKSNYLTALLIGFLIPIVFVLLKEFLNNKITERRDLEKLTSLPILGVIEHNSTNSNLVVIEDMKSSVTETFRSIRTNLQFFVPDKDKKVILVASLVPQEGKTFCSMNLATIIAMSGKKTLLLGFDLRKPRIHKEFSVSNEIGITSFLIGRVPFEKIIQQNVIENLDVISAGPVPPNPAELIGLPQVMEIFERLKPLYDYIVIDTPPLGLVSDALHLVKHADMSIVVVRENYSQKRSIHYLNDIIRTANFPNVGMILNDVKIQRSSYSYKNYGYGYGSRYYSDDNEIDLQEGKGFLFKLFEKIRKRFK